MNDIRNLNIWKSEETKTPNINGLRHVDIEQLNLSVRAFNCLKRADCHTVGDILNLLGEEGTGLRRIRNLGTRSETDIKENIEALREEYARRPAPQARQGRRLVKPARITMDCRIDDFPISGRALDSLHSSGVYYVQDLYSEDIPGEPGWFAVRELFDRILQQ